jgi:hypothetical protein
VESEGAFQEEPPCLVGSRLRAASAQSEPLTFVGVGQGVPQC